MSVRGSCIGLLICGAQGCSSLQAVGAAPAVMRPNPSENCALRRSRALATDAQPGNRGAAGIGFWDLRGESAQERGELAAICGAMREWVGASTQRRCWSVVIDPLEPDFAADDGRGRAEQALDQAAAHRGDAGAGRHSRSAGASSTASLRCGRAARARER